MLFQRFEVVFFLFVRSTAAELVQNLKSKPKPGSTNLAI